MNTAIMALKKLRHINKRIVFFSKSKGEMVRQRSRLVLRKMTSMKVSLKNLLSLLKVISVNNGSSATVLERNGFLSLYS